MIDKLFYRLSLKKVIRDKRLVTPAVKFNVFNTMQDIWVDSGICIYPGAYNTDHPGFDGVKR